MSLDLTKLKRETLATSEDEPRYYTYVSQDAVAVVKASGYFNGSDLRISDIIAGKCDNVRTLLQVASLNPVVTAEVTAV